MEKWSFTEVVKGCTQSPSAWGQGRAMLGLESQVSRPVFHPLPHLRSLQKGGAGRDRGREEPLEERKRMMRLVGKTGANLSAGPGGMGPGPSDTAREP